jgi:asparagine synthase (glutamine-hydrolysing)
MCGIAGIVGNTTHGTSAMADMLRVQQHRGPDGSHIWSDNDIILGHNRLSIIDLSDRGRQPMHSSDGRYVIVFNGEIYNYTELKQELSHYDFKSESDTEVLLAAYSIWGEQCLHRLNGMFSFAIWDRQAGSLFAARDRFGVKPFTYAIVNDTFYFASEIKALFAAGIPRIPNETVWSSYFVYGNYGAPNESFWQDIQKLPAAHCLTYSQGKLEVKMWYSFADEVKKYNNAVDKETAMAQYIALLNDSIRLRFRSDVPVGINISGGLDSSILLSLVNRYQPAEKTRAYTFYTGHPDYDETPYVDQMIAATANPLSRVKVSASDIAELADAYAWNQDEPYGGIPTIAYGALFKEARTVGVYVLLDGQGMDEQWAGYDYYRNRSDAIIQGVSRSPFYPHILTDTFRSKAVAPQYPKPFDDELRNKQYRDLFYTKLPRALRFSDRMSMMYSTELREPFLDHRLVEFAFSLPPEFKIRDQVSKYLLREIAATYLPEAISVAGKRALQTPQREWLANELKGWVEARLFHLAEYKPEWFDSEQLMQEWKQFTEGKEESSFHIWQYVNTSLLQE